MRTILLLLLFSVDVFGFFWKFSRSSRHTRDDSFENTAGRMFVTLLGYPPKCEQRGISHSCTLSFACWLVGGSSQPGCGANPWIVACCVTSKKALNRNNDVQQLQVREDSLALPVLQKRIDDLEECGLSADRILMKRIIGGDEAKFAQFPWQAFIKISSYQCGGVLVSRKFVATAAHCIITARLKDTLVYLGELDTQDTGKVKELEPAELHRVRRRIIHPNFQFRTTQPDRYDLALLELITEAGYSYHISPICLPPSDMVLTGRTAVVAGWGKIQPSNELMGTNVLRSATVPILDIRECLAWHEIKQISVELHEEMLCAGHESGKHDACLGDSGGPLIVLENGRWTLVGITSAGFGCGEPHQPGIYHKIPVTADWIRSVIRLL
ncbi:serine protease P84 [Tribolium castaneum]|uniref:Serine protease P84 n=1 Tax=Tribolium castaneum TaxID=7070 RepID=D6WT56_TRICA|nr:serine protease P84 [Tribolium castaneum]